MRTKLPAALLAAALVLSGGACGEAPSAAAPGNAPAAPPGPAPAAPASPGRLTPAGVARFPEGTTHVGDPSAPPTRAQLDLAIRKGAEYLLADQNADGSWGSPARTLTVDIYAPGAGSFEAYQVATSALAVSALAEVGDEVDPARAAAAVRRGADYLMAHSRVRRSTIDVLYNVWAHAYSLGAYARLLPKEKDPARRAAMKKAAADCVDMLVRFEYADGGWGYYDFDTGARNPALMATSFTTATVLAALRLAKDQGVDVPQRIVDRATRLLGLLRHPDGSFSYSWEHRYWPHGPINKIKGSLARTPACFKALRDWGVRVTDDEVARAFENLRKEGRFLALARKYPRPHETFYQNSGYFVFYGYYYASQLLSALPPERRALESASFTSYLLPLQEEDGSWWDYQLYTYHKPYGTAYVLMTLARCR